MRVEKLRLQNFRQFEDLAVEFSPHFNVVIGENGSGKSSILDSLAIGYRAFRRLMIAGSKPEILDNDIRLAVYEHSIEYQLPTRLSYWGDVACSNIAWSVEKKERDQSAGDQQDWNQLLSVTQQMKQAVQDGEENIIPIIVYFPAPRIWPFDMLSRPTKLESRLSAYTSAFNPIPNYKTFLEWYSTKEFAAAQKTEREFHELEVVRRAVTNCVEGCKNFYHDFDWGFLVVEMEDGSIMPIDRLSDGLKNMLAMVGDIAYRCYSHNPHLGQDALASPGIVLIDELDLHLHPRWQQHVVNDLKTTFPNIQFIATTHSPIILSSIDSEDKVILLDENDVQYLTHTQGRDVNDILSIYMDTEIKNDDLDHYFQLIESGLGESDEGVALRSRIEQASGADYHELARADLLLSFYE